MRFAATCGNLIQPAVLLAAEAGEARGDLELSMRTRLDHPGLSSGEDTLSRREQVRISSFTCIDHPGLSSGCLLYTSDAADE